MDRKKTHWISWDQICLPTAEGGLGVRKFEDILKAFSLKLWWRFREQSSLWATHMMKKYCSTTSPLRLSPSSRSNHTWKRLTKTWPTAHPLIRWTIGQGDIKFWDDIWLGNVPLRELSLDDRGSPVLRVSALWSDGDWCPHKLQQLHYQAGLPQAVVNDIKETPILVEGSDTPRWTLSNHGDFTIASAWDLQRTQGPTIPELEDIWNPCFTTSMSIFIWRLLSNRIQVDAKLQWRKISLASKCCCCPDHPNTESLQHLFIGGQAAQKVWREFDDWFPGQDYRLLLRDSIPDRMATWSRRVKQAERTHLSRIIPGLIFWFIWAERNNSRHNDVQFRPQNISWQISMHIRKLAIGGKLKPSLWQGCSPTVSLGIQVPICRAPKRRIMIKWHPPDHPWIKLNTSSSTSSDRTQTGGGGTARDHQGNLICAYAVPFAGRSPLEAAIQTIAAGVNLVKARNCPIWIESDDAQAISPATADNMGPAVSRHSMVSLRLALRGTIFRATQMHRKGNMAARFLSDMASAQPSPQIFDHGSAPNLLKALIRLDQLGLPSFVWEGDSDI